MPSPEMLADLGHADLLATLAPGELLIDRQDTAAATSAPVSPPLNSLRAPLSSSSHHRAGPSFAWHEDGCQVSCLKKKDADQEHSHARVMDRLLGEPSQGRSILQDHTRTGGLI